MVAERKGNIVAFDIERHLLVESRLLVKGQGDEVGDGHLKLTAPLSRERHGEGITWCGNEREEGYY